MSGGSAPDYGPLAAAQRYAADLEYEASLRAIDASQRQYDQTREDFRPWREIGQDALADISARLDLDRGDPDSFYNAPWEQFTADDMHQDPGYAFRQREGQKAIRRAINAGSGSYSGGATLKALTRWNQDFASQEFDRARQRAVSDYGIEQNQRNTEYNTLASLAGQGQVATHSTAGFGASAVNQQNSYRMQGAQALGRGAIGAESAMIQQQIHQNQLDQQRFNNIMGIVGLGLGAASVFYNPRPPT